MGEVVTKAALCVHCADIVGPYRNWQTNRDWRWCQCLHTGTRWADGTRGLIEVTSVHGPDHVRVVGINNGFLQAAVSGGSGLTEPQWRELHDLSCARVAPGYLFHEGRRRCWALLVAVGESGDVTYVPNVIPPSGPTPDGS